MKARASVLMSFCLFALLIVSSVRFQVFIALCGTFDIARLERADEGMSPRVDALVEPFMTMSNNSANGESSTNLAHHTVRTCFSAVMRLMEEIPVFSQRCSIRTLSATFFFSINLIA